MVDVKTSKQSPASGSSLSFDDQELQRWFIIRGRLVLRRLAWRFAKFT